MKIILDVDRRILEYEKGPMPPERFVIACKLAGAAIGGAVVAQVLYGLYKLG